MTTLEDTKVFWEEYLSQRRGTYEFRCQRYDAVIAKMMECGLGPNDTVIDVGAGRCEFQRRLSDTGWEGHYIPLDGSIDGTDLNDWHPRTEAEWFVAIELLEHLHNPWVLMYEMVNWASKGVIATTPNPKTTDVLGMDPTHVTPLSECDFTFWGWRTEVKSFFSGPDDSILAWRYV